MVESFQLVSDVTKIEPNFNPFLFPVLRKNHAITFLFIATPSSQSSTAQSTFREGIFLIFFSSFPGT